MGAVLILCLMAMVFRNIYLILKTARGQTKFSKGATPFQEDVTRMIREIGIFYLAAVVVGLACSVLAVLILGPETTETSLNLSNVMVGLLMLCLSQAFADGTKLRQDVDGLL